jgi:signal transduction histidine kinase
MTVAAESGVLSDHCVQFYMDDRVLVTAVAQHIAAGMRAGGAGLSIATAEHTSAITDALAHEGVNVAAACARSQLTLADAHEGLAAICSDKPCDVAKFEALVDKWIRPARSMGKSIYAFAEMVDVLCAKSQYGKMIELERLWNDIVSREKVFLLCGYRLDHLARANQVDIFSSICTVHRRVLPAQPWLVAGADVQRVAAELEQHSLALRSEVDDRRRVEREMDNLRDAFGVTRATAESLAAANEELKHFASVCAHDLREPLRMVTKFIELFLRRYGEGLNDEARHFISNALDGAHRMGELIGGMLDWARSGAELKREPVDLNSVLDVVLRSRKLAITEAGASVRRAHLPVVYGDRSALQRVLQNLIDNAIKYRAEQPPIIDISVEEQPEMWRISVSDNGIGMAAAEQELVFTDFERLPAAGNFIGTGLGLGICRRIIEKHGGRIWIEAARDRGTTVHFTVRKAALG